MKGAVWHVPDDGLPTAVESPSAGTVSLAFIRTTLRRLWYLWLALAVAGVSLAAAWLLVVPARSVGTVTLLLAHDATTQPETAMATDLSLLQTRTVAQELSDRLSLGESPQEIQDSILAQSTATSVLTIEIDGSDSEDAVARARALAEIYLGFREEQLLRQSDALIDSQRQRIAALQSQVDDLNEQYDVVTAGGGDDAQAADILSLRAQYLTQITTLESQMQDASLEVSAVVAASRILDPASLVPQSSLRRLVLALGSGLVGGLGIGFGLVLIYAVTTGRLRSRSDVAAAIGHPVTYSAPRVSRRWRRPGPREVAGLELLVDGFLSALPTARSRSSRLGLIAVDCTREGAMVVAAAAERLRAEKSVATLDLGDTGVLEDAVHSASSDDAQPEGRVVSVAKPETEPVAEVVLSLVPFEIGRGLAHVKSSTPKCVVLAKAGRSTAEGLQTVAQAARAVGVDIAFVMLVGTDSTDDSFGGAAGAEKKAPRVR